MASFIKARFSRDAKFPSAQFSKETSFNHATFLNKALFSVSVFRGTARFDGSTFLGNANFLDAEFAAGAVFEGAVFRAEADLSSSEPGNYSFNKFSRLDFRGVRFLQSVRFINRRFLDKVDFSGTQFLNEAPEFYGCELHQGTQFSAATKFADTSPKSAAAYRTLKQAMEERRARDEQGLFFALEQKCRRGDPDTPRLVRMGSGLYDFTADYGQSLSRPLLCLFGAFAVFYLIYLGAMTGAIICWDDAERVLRFTLEQVFRPFRVFGDDCVAIHLALFASMHSLLNFALLTLFIVAVRRRFRIA